MEKDWRIYVKKHPKQKLRNLKKEMRISGQFLTRSLGNEFINSLGTPMKNIVKVRPRKDTDSFNRLTQLWGRAVDEQQIGYGKNNCRYMIKMLSTRSSNFNSVRLPKEKKYFLSPNQASLNKKFFQPTYFKTKKPAMEIARVLCILYGVSIYPDLVFLVDRHTSKEILVVPDLKTETSFNQIFLIN